MTPTFLIIVITAHSNHSVVYSNFVISHLSRSLLLRCYDYVISDKRIFSGSPNLKYFCTSLRVEVFTLFSTCCPKAGKSIKEYEYEIIAQCNKQIVRFHIFNSLSLFFIDQDATLLQRQTVTIEKKEKHQTTSLGIIRADRDDQIPLCTNFNKILQAVLQVHETGRIQILRGV